MPAISATQKQVSYLNNIARAAQNYRRTLEQLQSMAEFDLDRLRRSTQPSGPSHQTLAEASRYYGELSALLSGVFLIFDTSIFDENENADDDRRAFVNQINEWVAIAIGEPGDDDYMVWFIAE